LSSVASTAVGSADRSGSLYMVARVISDVLSPAALAVPGLMLGVWASGDPSTFRYALLYFAFAVPVPMLYVIWLLKTGRVADIHLPNRHERVGPFAVASAAALAGVVALVFIGAPAVFVAPIIAALIQTLLLFAITLAWQISIHTSTSAGLATFAALSIGGGAILFSLLVPIVMWARLYLKRHTLAQTLAGAALGCGSFAGLFLLQGIAW
jgi:membrane-associated phospholipid phosphatase